MHENKKTQEKSSVNLRKSVHLICISHGKLGGAERFFQELYLCSQWF